MNKWFKVGVKYYPIDPETGEAKAKTEFRLIEATGFTDAEFTANEKLSDLLRLQGEVVSMERKQYGYLIKGTEDQSYFETKIEVVMDGAKVQKNTVLIAGYGFTEALEELNNNLKREYANFKVSKMQESGIVDILPFSEENVLANKALQLENGLFEINGISFFKAQTVDEETGEVFDVTPETFKGEEEAPTQPEEAPEEPKTETFEIPEAAAKKYGIKKRVISKPTQKASAKKPAQKKPTAKKQAAKPIKKNPYALPE